MWFCQAVSRATVMKWAVSACSAMILGTVNVKISHWAFTVTVARSTHGVCHVYPANVNVDTYIHLINIILYTAMFKLTIAILRSAFVIM